MSNTAWARLVVLAGVVIVLGFVSEGWTGAPKGNSYALLIGERDYVARSTLGPLKYTENDVEELAKVLKRAGSPFRGNVRVLTCTRGTKDNKDQPRAANIRKAITALCDTAAGRLPTRNVGGGPGPKPRKLLEPLDHMHGVRSRRTGSRV
jgi:hypothetical protein